MIQEIEYINKEKSPCGRIKAAVFDFDGTFSTLRCGWEKVMEPLMLECISGGKKEAYPPELTEKVKNYIDTSTGIQTIYQMQWLKEETEKAGFGSSDKDAWYYKDEYNRRLMSEIKGRIESVKSGEKSPENFLIKGAVNFLNALIESGIEVYLASGTDHCDVVKEASALGVADKFTEIKGAPERKAACSKEAVIRMILEEKNLPGEALLLVGDGKVEIALGKECGAFTIGAATNEEALEGVNPVKRERLIKAGADIIIGDFQNLKELKNWLGI
ncbi:MAG: HAD family hydrolase [Ruminococcaceae bacterium]|nr:HAD family hydrolase [Oscillospiraceae bacterium]